MNRSRTKWAAFTLVEIMLSTVVLVIIALIVAQLASSSTTISTLSRKRLDADSQARTVFDRIETDVDQMLRRNDVDYIFFKNVPGANSAINDAMFFYSRGPAYFDSRPSDAAKGIVRLLGYRINTN